MTPMNKDNRSQTPKIVGIILGIAVIGGAIAWAFGYDKAAEPTDTASSTPDGTASSTQGAPATTTAPTQSTGEYKDGTYRADGSYVSPAGAESVTIGVTLKGDTIVDATFEGHATNPTSRKLQGQFAAGYKQFVIGKKVDDVSLTVVNGASLAPKGFMDALAEVKAEARG